MRFRLNYDYYNVPTHTKESFERYFFGGCEPGSFLKSVLCNDLIGAATRCDSENRTYLTDIVKWMANTAPHGSWGSPEAYESWVHDQNNIRTQFVDRFEKRMMWDALATAGEVK